MSSLPNNPFAPFQLIARGCAGSVLAALLGTCLGSCTPHYEELPTFSTERKLLQMVVEMPAGTNHVRRYDPATRTFVPVRRAGLELVVEFLPCPGNFGFVPGTQLGATAAPLPALVLTEAQLAGTVLEITPIGLLTLDDNGVLRPIVLAVPVRPSQQILPAVTSWQELLTRFPGARETIRQWFLHQARTDEIRVVSWKDEKAAERQVKAAMR